jgi:hypothetical protein
MAYTFLYAWDHYVNGNVIGHIRRMLEGEQKIDIPFYIPNGKSFKKGIPPSLRPLPLFGVDTLTNALAPVIICEGQKCQAAYQSLGFQCVTSISGAQSAEGSDWTPLAQASHIWFSPDNDTSGEGYCRSVFSILLRQNKDREFKVIRLPGIKQKQDICDWLKLQPELTSWNEYDPFSQSDVRNRLDTTIADHLYDVLADWYKEEDWGEPENLEPSLKPIARLQPDMIPEVLRPWMIEAEKINGFPLEFLAVAAITVLSTLVGTRCKVKPKVYGPWLVTPNLWGVLIGPPSAMKSPCLNYVIKPLENLDNLAHEQYEKEVVDWEKDKMVNDAEKKTAVDGVKKKGRFVVDEYQPLRKHPPKYRYLTHDATIEAIGSLCADNPRGLLLFQDELTKLVKGWESEGKAKDRPFFLAAWNGDQAYTVDRVSASSYRIAQLCVSILGGMQPDSFRSYILDSQTDLNDGLLQRFQLAVYLDKREIDYPLMTDEPGGELYSIWKEMVEKVATADFAALGAERSENEIYFRFDKEAQEDYFKWYEGLTAGRKVEENDYLEQHWTKYTTLFPSLSIIFHMLEVFFTGRIGPIRSTSTILAGRWCSWLQAHARRIYGIRREVESASVEILCQKIRDKKIETGFTLRALLHKRWARITEPELVEKVLKELCEMHWLRRVQSRPPGQIGKGTVHYEINPKFL